MQSDDAITATTSIDVHTPVATQTPRPPFDPEAVLAAMHKRDEAVKEASAKYLAATEVSQALLDFEIRV